MAIKWGQNPQQLKQARIQQLKKNVSARRASRPQPKTIRINDSFDITRREMKEYDRLERQARENRSRVSGKADKIIPSNLVRDKYDTSIIRFRPAKTRELGQIKTRQEFDRRLGALRVQTAPGFYDARAETYKRNVITAAEKSLPAQEAMRIKELINQLSSEQFQWALLNYAHVFDIQYIYDAKLLGQTENGQRVIVILEEALKKEGLDLR